MSAALIDGLTAARVMAVLRRRGIAKAITTLAPTLRAMGVTAIECTMDDPGALDAIHHLIATREDGELIGAGTVVSPTQVDALVRAGADFAVTPHLDERLLAHAVARGLPMMPGVLTPSEIARATALGAVAVKLFPAGPLGTSFLAALRGPFPDVPIIPTGGISIEDVPAWLEAGAMCVGLGSALTRGTEPPAELRAVLRPRP